MNVEIAERLAKRRREAGYSQESLAEKLGVSRQAVSKWERSESSPDTDNLIALAQLYGVSIDDLLYVGESLKDDVAFEAADKAATRKDSPAGTSADSAGASDADSAADVEFAAAFAAEGASKVKVGLGGIHFRDGEDYVHLSWKDGVHVKDSEDGDEVHIGWKGIHIKEGRKHTDSDFLGDEIKIEALGDWDDAAVIVNGKRYDSWEDAHVAFKDRYGIEKTWLKFPFPLVVIIAYILIGALMGEWVIGLFIFFLIPIYYMIGHAAYSRKISSLLEGLYPLGCTIWFLWVAFVNGQPHPAWVVFLTIPVVDWVIHVIAKGYQRRKREAEVLEVPDVTE